jgi:Ulp1 family protease
MYYPINRGNSHWMLAVAYMKEKKLCFYDSMSGLTTHDMVLAPGGEGNSIARRYLHGVLRHIQDETTRKKKDVTVNALEWTLVLAATPQQYSSINGENDCGGNCAVFMMLFADFLTDDIPFTFKNSDMTMFRRKVAAAIMRGSLDYKGNPAVPSAPPVSAHAASASASVAPASASASAASAFYNGHPKARIISSAG